MTYTKEDVTEKLKALIYDLGVLSDQTGKYNDALNQLYTTLQLVIKDE
jgi:uncharacterized FlgJ-related protein